LFGPDVEKYTVQYTAGTCGTLLTWFVNQHRGFPGGRFEVAPEYDLFFKAKSLHWRCAEQHWADVVENLTYDLDKVNITQFETACFKTFPHDVIHDIQDKKILTQTLNSMTTAGITNWIYPVFYRDTRYPYETNKVANRKYQVIAERHKDPMWINNKNSGFYSIWETQDLHSWQNARLMKYIMQYDIKPLFLDMAALLGNDTDEYDRLVKFLNTERLTDWHSVLMSGVQFWEMPCA
jgi:hypothetical protein